MGQLTNFPMVSQRHDGNINADFDCVPTSIAAALEFYTHKSYTGGEVKDAVYGASYQGGTAARAYIGYCKQQGVELYPIDNSDLVALVVHLRSEIDAGHPVLITEPDPYMPAGSGYTHVGVAYADDAHGVTIMDPFIAAPVYQTNDEWAHILRDNEIWGMKPLMGKPANWSDDGTALRNPSNKYVVVRGFRDYILNNAWAGDNYPQENETARNPLEDSNPGQGGGTQQTFRFSMLGWDTKQGVFVESVGQELVKCRQELVALRSSTPVGGSDATSKKLAAQAIAILQTI